MSEPHHVAPSERDVCDRARQALEGIGQWSYFDSGWVVEFANQCTCYGGWPMGHEPGCGYEAVGKAEAHVGRFAADASILMPDLVAEVERLRAELGGAPTNTEH